MLSAGSVWAGPEDRWCGDAVAFAPDGRLLAAGTLAAVSRAAGPHAGRLERQDACVIPGFVDAHVHVRAAASVAVATDCSDVRDADALIALVAAAVGKVGPQAGGWATLASLEPDLMAGGLPSTVELDAASGPVPVRVRHRSLHAWLLNSAGWAALGMPTSDGWWIDDHGAMGQAVGRQTEARELDHRVADFSSRLLEQGVTALADLTPATPASPDASAALQRWRAEGLLRQQTVDYCRLDGPRLKLVIDGAYEVAAVRDALRRGWDAGRQVAVHCADLESLGILIAAAGGVPGAGRGRLRIEHASQAPPEWLPLVAELRAVVVTHPGFIFAHGDRYLGRPELAPHEWLYRLRSWADSGCGLAVGSDAPAGPADPLVAWRAACDRRTGSGKVLGPDEMLPAETALAAMTAWAADACDMPCGRLRPGLSGDVVLLTGCAEGRLDPAHAQVAGVVLGGRPHLGT